MWPYSACTAASASSACDALLGRLADPDEDPARERDLQLAGGADRVEPLRRVLGRRALVHDQVGVDRLEHQPLRRGHLAQPRQLVARRPRRCSCAAASRARAPRSHAQATYDGEVLVPVLAQPRARPRRSPRASRRSGRAAPSRRAAPRRRAASRPRPARTGAPVRRERAVLAVALARPRQRQREVPREGDPPQHCGAVYARRLLGPARAQPTGLHARRRPSCRAG